MLSTSVKSPIISILFYFCVIEVKYRKQNLSFKPLDELSILMKLPVCNNLKIVFVSFFFCILSKSLESFVFSPHPLPHDKGLWSLSLLVHVFTYGSISSVLYAFIPGWGGGGGYWNMKLVYTCRAGYKNERLRSGPSLKMGGFQSGP